MTMDICRHDEDCGGCIYQGKEYRLQLEEKEKTVSDLLKKWDIHPLVHESIQGSLEQYGYRNKMEYTFGDMVKDGDLTLGMHKKGHFMSIVTVDHCQLVHEDFNRVLGSTLDFCQQYPKYHKKTHRGLLRNLILRRGVRTNQLLINIVTTSQEHFDEKGFVAMIQGLSLDHEVVGVLHTINDDLADAVKIDEIRTLYGQDFYEEEIAGLRFSVSAFSFFQTNVASVERLYEEAVALMGDYGGKRVFDLFCGTGTISQIIAQRAKEVIGIELVEEAVEAARINAKKNGLTNCTFIAGDVFEELKTLEQKPDLIVVDPPRVGIHKKALQKIGEYGVKEILYISCNPKTLMADLDGLKAYGYDVQYLKTYDNFPNTKHIEAVTLLTK